VKPITAAIVALFLVCSVGSTVHAVQSELPVALQATIPPPNLKVSSWALMDASTGVMIAAAKPDRRVEPASLSKLMTAYLVFRGIDSGEFRLDEEVLVSENVAIPTKKTDYAVDTPRPTS